MRVLVTGGTGFLGRHVCRLLLGQGHDVRMMGRSFSEADVLITAGVEPLSADLRDRVTIMAACRGIDAVVHAGALSSPWGPAKTFHAINVLGTQAVVEGCLRHGVPRLVYISSPSVIFDGSDHVNVTETTPYPARFTSTYALTKKLGEDVVNSASARMETIILRPKAIFGPGDNALLPRLVEVARRGRLPQIGDGRNLVDLTYVENVAQAISLALSAPNAPGNIYHITNDTHVSLWDAIRNLLGELGLPGPRRSLGLRTALRAAAIMESAALLTRREPLLTRYSVLILVRNQTYDISAAKRDLGYRPQVGIPEAIARTVESLRSSPVMAKVSR